MKVVRMAQQPPVMVTQLMAGAKYHLKVFSHERDSISSKSITFKTKPGETPPGRVELSVQQGATVRETLSAEFRLIILSRLGDRAGVFQGQLEVIRKSSLTCTTVVDITR